MLSPDIATIVIIGAAIFLLVIIPMLDGSQRFAKFISLRYTLVAVALIMALGCVLNFSHLTESSRNIVLMGGMILVGIFVFVRSIEKIKLGSRNIEVKVSKGDASAEAKIINKEK